MSAAFPPRPVVHPHLSSVPDDQRRRDARVDAPPVPEAERRALLVSAAVLMDEALRLLDSAGSSITGVWLRHAIECLDLQSPSPDGSPAARRASFDAATVVRSD